MAQLPPPTEDPATYRTSGRSHGGPWTMARFDLNDEGPDLRVFVSRGDGGDSVTFNAEYGYAVVDFDQARRLAAFLTAEIDRIEASGDV